MKVAIMGAAGWVGRAVLESFAGRHQVRAFDYSPEAWATYRRFDGEWEGEKLYGDIADFDAVHRTLEGMDGVVHLAAYFGYENPPEVDVNPFLINLKGMWNVLESARRHQLKRVVHMSSCVVQHPDGVFLSSEVRSKEGSLYGISKRLQEEMCRQFHDAYGQRSSFSGPVASATAGSGSAATATPPAAALAGSAGTIWQRPATWRLHPRPLISTLCTRLATQTRISTAT